ncbi:hypothetical protein BDR26DRAFT_854397 [Obelidium mucronatum]|nr:hypothetical protein BDR26DRAFT_854397 [Obelidium mucronatum]
MFKGLRNKTASTPAQLAAPAGQNALGAQGALLGAQAPRPDARAQATPAAAATPAASARSSANSATAANSNTASSTNTNTNKDIGDDDDDEFGCVDDASLLGLDIDALSQTAAPATTTTTTTKKLFANLGAVSRAKAQTHIAQNPLRQNHAAISPFNPQQYNNLHTIPHQQNNGPAVNQSQQEQQIHQSQQKQQTHQSQQQRQIHQTPRVYNNYSTQPQPQSIHKQQPIPKPISPEVPHSESIKVASPSKSINSTKPLDTKSKLLKFQFQPPQPPQRTPTPPITSNSSLPLKINQPGPGANVRNFTPAVSTPTLTSTHLPASIPSQPIRNIQTPINNQDSAEDGLFSDSDDVLLAEAMQQELQQANEPITAVKKPGKRLPGPAGELPQFTSPSRLNQELQQGTGPTFTPSSSSSSNADSNKKARYGLVDGDNSSISGQRNSNLFDGLPPTTTNQNNSDFTKLPWVRMKQCVRGYDSFPTIDKITPTYITQVKNKIPDLVVLIKDLKQTEHDASVVFLDPFGELRGNIHGSVFDLFESQQQQEQHDMIRQQQQQQRGGQEAEEASCVSAGSVLHLKNISVFSVDGEGGVYVNVTSRNVHAVFSDRGVRFAQ